MSEDAGEIGALHQGKPRERQARCKEEEVVEESQHMRGDQQKNGKLKR